MFEKVCFLQNDFENLKYVQNKNEKSFYPQGDYPNNEFRERVRLKQKPTWNKMRDLKNNLAIESFFDKRFYINVSNPHKESNQYKPGEIREGIWIYMVDKRLFNKEKNTATKEKYAHLLLPQVQVSLRPEKFVTASIWLEERNCEYKYRGALNNFLSSNKISKEYQLIVYNRETDTSKYFSNLHKMNDEILKSFFDNMNLSIGLQKKISISECKKSGNMIQAIVIEDLQQLLEEIYYPCFKFKNTGKIVNPAKLPSRLGREKFEIMSSMQKGKQKTRITYKQREIQNSLLDHLREKYKYKAAIVKLEADFVDVKAEFINEEKVILYEVKTNNKALQCVKNSLGQLLFYSMLHRQFKKIELVVVGLNKSDQNCKTFITMVKNILGKDNFRYQRFDERNCLLMKESES